MATSPKATVPFHIARMVHTLRPLTRADDLFSMVSEIGAMRQV
ncbi:hypothetical protein [Kutzneria chonburiensis]|nr:hypothetical protein [Kutzneria chonburiensis]